MRITPSVPAVVSTVLPRARRAPVGTALTGFLDRQVCTRPASVAVVGEGRDLTFLELREDARRLAARLRGLGAGADACVGLFVEPSVELAAGAWGVLYAGAGYLPLSPEYPEDRLRYMIEDNGTRIVVTQEHLRELNPREAALMDQGNHGGHHQSKASRLQVKAQLSDPGLRDLGRLMGRERVELPGRRETEAQRRETFARKTYRFYEGGPVTRDDLTALLAPSPAGAFGRDVELLSFPELGRILRWFGQFHSDERLLPKYAYASPGALYATRAGALPRRDGRRGRPRRLDPPADARAGRGVDPPDHPDRRRDLRVRVQLPRAGGTAAGRAGDHLQGLRRRLLVHRGQLRLLRRPAGRRRPRRGPLRRAEGARRGRTGRGDPGAGADPAGRVRPLVRTRSRRRFRTRSRRRFRTRSRRRFRTRSRMAQNP
ncbi:AMP-binding protein [Kitasatospora aureofaciens]|nr:AMP-binding protein [Kitasatospora aureofaciens]MBV6702363.1 AMP-binding protein [Kitasatospora aureofaciens]